MSADPWTERMRRGDFAAAWLISDAALRERAGVPCWHLPRHLQWIWDGRPLRDQRVLIRCYHGLGDTIQFIRYAPLVRAVAAEVTVWAQPGLLPLVRSVRGVDRVLPLHDGTPVVEYDVDVDIMELPHIFRTTLDTIPAAVPYLHTDPAPLPDHGRLRVGIAWRAGDWDARRNIPFDQLAPLEAVGGIDWYILQGRPGLAERRPHFGTVVGTDSLIELAQVVRALDLVITIDSMPAHLAGALARPTWTLLHAEPDWRWMLDREDSPWYPTMRLFRQRRAGDWHEVLVRVAAELSRLVRS